MGMYPNAYTVAQSLAGPYDNSDNPAAQAALAADVARQKALANPAVKLAARTHLISAADLARNNGFASKGIAIMLGSAQVAAGRALVNNDDYRRGFDVATGGCQGRTETGPGQDAVRASLCTEPTVRSCDDITHGFDVGQAIQFGISKVQAGNANGLLLSGNPNVATGQLIATGLNNNGQTGDQKAATIASTLNNAQTKAGAAQAIAVHKGFFARIAEFFGL